MLSLIARLINLEIAQIPENPDVENRRDLLFLDIQSTLTILEMLFLGEPSTSNIEGHHGEPPQNVQA
jgi:hypothetical protein